MSTEKINASQEQAPDQQPKKKTVKLKSFEIIDFKVIDKLLATDIDGNHFMVFGKNGNGKTSLAQAIARNAVRLDPKEIAALPVRVGAKNARVLTTFVIDEDGKQREILIEATYRPSGTVVKVIDLYNKGELTPPVKQIISLLGESHDVAELMDLSPEDQFKKLLTFLGGKISAEAFELEYDEKYQSRKNIKRLIKEEETFITEIEPSVDIMRDYRTKGMYTEKKTERPTPPVKDDLVREEMEAKSHNENIGRKKERRREVELNIEHLRKQLAAEEAKLADIDKWLESNPEKDMTAFPQKYLAYDEKLREYNTQLDNFDTYNEIVDKVARYLQRKSILESNHQKLDVIEKELKEVKGKMQSAVAELKLEEIVPELTIKFEIDETNPNKPVWRKGIYYKNWDGSLLPFSTKQISYGKMIVSLCKLSSFINYGKFNLFNIRAWNELDKESQQEIIDFANQNEDLSLQLLIESVEEKPLGIRIIEKKTDAKS